MRLRRILVCLLSLAILCSYPITSTEAGSILTGRRVFGLLFLGGSALLAKKAQEYHENADEIYERYKRADTSEEADRLFKRTTREDVKSHVSLALSAAFALNGMRLILLNNSAKDYQELSERSRRLSIDIKSDLGRKELWVGLTKEF